LRDRKIKEKNEALSKKKMELRELGRTGLKLSSVGFGASPLGNVFGSVSEEQANASVRLAFQSGINFFDTSPYVTKHYFLSLSFFSFSSSNLTIFRKLKLLRRNTVRKSARKGIESVERSEK
jgi:predicted aldo/keto reductase-like oxidoreductase